MIQILVALFINFRALKVVKWATMLPAAANPVSVDPFKYSTKRSESEEVFDHVKCYTIHEIYFINVKFSTRVAAYFQVRDIT